MNMLYPVLLLASTAALAQPLDRLTETMPHLEPISSAGPTIGSSLEGTTKAMDRDWITKQINAVESIFEDDKRPGSMSIDLSTSHNCIGHFKTVTKEANELHGFKFADVRIRGSCEGGTPSLELYQDSAWHLVIGAASHDECNTLEEIRDKAPIVDSILRTPSVLSWLTKIPGSIKATCN